MQHVTDKLNLAHQHGSPNCPRLSLPWCGPSLFFQSSDGCRNLELKRWSPFPLGLLLVAAGLVWCTWISESALYVFWPLPENGLIFCACSGHPWAARDLGVGCWVLAVHALGVQVLPFE